MHLPAYDSGNLLCNGGFLPGLWTRLQGEEQAALPCPVTAQTFAADRWHVRYAAPEGGEVAQARSMERPPGAAVRSSLEIRGGEGVAETVYAGQNIEADSVPAHALRFRAWCCVEHPQHRACPVRLVVGSPARRDLFDRSVEAVAQRETILGPNAWSRLDFVVDVTGFRPFGLRVELAFSPSFLAHPAARVRLANVSLVHALAPEPASRPFDLEAVIARRFYQRHDGHALNAVGRALTCNPHELHFQFTFPPMRTLPNVTLPQDNSEFCVYSSAGGPQDGFIYDVPFRARGSAIIRATKLNHQLRDGYLVLRTSRGAILLDAEL